jgi:hypothetical protein
MYPIIFICMVSSSLTQTKQKTKEKSCRPNAHHPVGCMHMQKKKSRPMWPCAVSNTAVQTHTDNSCPKKNIQTGSLDGFSITSEVKVRSGAWECTFELRSIFCYYLK